MGRFIVGENYIAFTMRGEFLKIEPYGIDRLRIRTSRNTVLSDERWTLMPPEDCKCSIENSGNSVKLICGILSAEIVKTWNNYQIIFRKSGEEILRTYADRDPANKFTHVEGDHYCAKISFEADSDEHFYGLGQEEQDFFDRKGCAYDIVNYNTKSTVPFVYSSLGYGFLWNNPSPGRCEFGNNRMLWQSDSTYQADFVVIGGKTPADIMKKYCELTGFAPKFPKWAAGFWQCKLRYEQQETLMQAAREYKGKNIPLSAIVIDYFHWMEQGNWEFDPKYWQNPQKMCDELHELGVEPVVSIWPTINPDSRNYDEMNDRNMLVRTENGQFGIFPFHGQQTYIDPTNPETRKFVWDKVKGGYYSYGIKTFWLDQAEPEVFPRQFNNLRFHIGNGAQVGLLYPYYYSKLFYDALKSEGEDEIVLLTRACYTGSQRFGAIVWNGDIPSTFRSLRQSVVSGLSMAMCGIVWWNSDIGGFHGGDTESEYFRELIVRWFQFGVFSPVMRLHGTRKRHANQRDCLENVKEPSGGDNEIWSFGEQNYPILKSLIELRERLIPYIMHHMDKASETGTPIMRPMFFDYFDDNECYKLSDQYMFGSDILFAPILDENQTSRRVYLPHGNWIRTADKQTYCGGRYIECDAEIDEFIAFVKDGCNVIDVFI